MADIDITGRAPRAIMVNTYGFRTGIDIPIGSIRPGEYLNWSGVSLTSQRVLPFDVGMYTGPAPQGVGNYLQYMGWIGNNRLIASDNFARAQWSDIEAPNFIFDAWPSLLNQRPDITLQLTVPLLPDTLDPSVAQNWTDGATGVHDAHWNTLGDYIAARSIKRIIIRLHHEFNLAPIPGGSITNWKTYWRRVVNLLRAKFTTASGILCKFCWNPTVNGGTDLDAFWPGEVQDATVAPADFGGISNASGGSPASTNLRNRIMRAYPFRRRMPCPEVDFIGVDVYDQNGSSYVNGVQPTAAQQHEAFWSYLSNFNEFPQSATSTGSLNYMDVLSRETGTPLCVPEWGCWESGKGRPAGGDSPVFIMKMYDWMRRAGVSYGCYFDYTDATQDAYHQLWPGATNAYVTQFPKARDLYLSLF